MSDELERQFHAAMVDIYHRAKDETGYTPSYFLQMVTEHGGVETARRLISSAAPSDGYTKLWELKRLDLSVEALVADNKRWHPLFTRQELRAARARLEQYKYFAGA